MSTNLLVTKLSDGTFMVGNDSNIYPNGLIDPSNVPSSIKIPETVTIIGRFAFYKCSQITSVSLPNSLKQIRESAFDQCSISIDTLNLPDSLISLGQHSFAANDIKVVNLNTKLRNIHNDPFGQNLNLQKIVSPESNLYFSTDAQGALYSKKQDFLKQVPSSKTSFSIPSSVKEIESKAFDTCQITEIILPASIQIISSYSFYHCSQLQKIHIYCTCFNRQRLFETLSELKEIYYYRNTEVTREDLFYYSSENPNVYTCDDYPKGKWSSFTITGKIGKCFITPKPIPTPSKYSKLFLIHIYIFVIYL